MCYTYGVFFEVVGITVVGFVRCGLGLADDTDDEVNDCAEAFVGVGLCLVDVIGIGVVVRFDGLRDVTDGVDVVGRRNVVSSCTDWNVCNLMFSVVVGIFSNIGCSLLPSVLPVANRIV